MRTRDFIKNYVLWPVGGGAVGGTLYHFIKDSIPSDIRAESSLMVGFYMTLFLLAVEVAGTTYNWYNKNKTRGENPTKT